MELKVVFIFILLFFVSSCTKNPVDQTPPPVVPITPIPPPAIVSPIPDIIVDNKWECQIDGISFSGTIDTSFLKIEKPSLTAIDTLIDCIGTSFDKKTNVRFRIVVNRSSNPQPLSTAMFNALITVDTSANGSFVASGSTPLPTNIKFTVDSLISNKLKATFNGTISMPVQSNGAYYSTYHSVTEGKFSCEFGKGNNEAKFFSFEADNLTTAGYIPFAKFSSNTLSFDGNTYGELGSFFRLTVFTGATVKPGTFKSSNQQAGIMFFSPSFYPYWMDGNFGSVNVIISSVDYNIVRGFFTGTNFNGHAISNGQFSCRIKNYYPYLDSVNKWEYENILFGRSYNLMGGNILYASKKFTDNKYQISIRGETDLNRESFKLAISSRSPIDTGTYVVYNTTTGLRSLDTLYIRSSDRLYQNVDAPNFSYTFCHIDKIDDKVIIGTMGENIQGNDLLIRKGKFKALFY